MLKFNSLHQGKATPIPPPSPSKCLDSRIRIIVHNLPRQSATLPPRFVLNIQFVVAGCHNRVSNLFLVAPIFEQKKWNTWKRVIAQNKLENLVTNFIHITWLKLCSIVKILRSHPVTNIHVKHPPPNVPFKLKSYLSALKNACLWLYCCMYKRFLDTWYAFSRG